MPTNEERKALAKRLRVLASHAPADADMVLDALDLYPGEYIEGFDPMCVERLADLIEPEERTCRNVAKDKKTWFVCGKCLYECSPPTMVKFCFNCGCKVVE